MNLRKKLTVSALALSAVLGTADAANADNWTGCHVGAFGGVSAVKHELTSRYSESYEGTPYWAEEEALNGLGGDGIQIGVAAGCDYQQPSSRLVVGGFADYAIQELETTASGSGTYYGEPEYAYREEVSIDNQWSIGARAGVLVNAKTLAYALVAYTQADTSGNFDGGLTGDDDETLKGWQVGGGLETYITPRLSLKGEYRYSVFDTHELASGAYVDGDYAGSWREDLDTTQHTFRVGLNYHLGGMDAPLVDDDSEPALPPVAKRPIK
jgi:outer membrane immunogenic protein